MPLSQSPLLRLLAPSFFGTICIGFGINAILNPESALSFFELRYPLLPDQKNLVDALLVVYGVRDIFMGLALFVAAYFGSSLTLGWLMIAIGGVAGVDGWVCQYYVGSGAANHWGYAPVVAALGLVFAAGI